MNKKLLEQYLNELGLNTIRRNTNRNRRNRQNAITRVRAKTNLVLPIDASEETVQIRKDEELTYTGSFVEVAQFETDDGVKCHTDISRVFDSFEKIEG